MTFPVRRSRRDGRRPLADFVDRQGPFLTAYLDVSAGRLRETAAERLELALQRMASRAERSLTSAQATMARQSVDLIEPEDATLAIIADPAGDGLITGFPSAPPDDLVVVADLPVLGPLILAEQARIHHVIAVVAETELTFVVVPRHGQPVHRTVTIDADEQAITTIGRLAEETDTSLVVVAATPDRRAPIESGLGCVLPSQTDLELVAQTNDVDALAGAVTAHLADRAATKERKIARFWTFHLHHDQAVDGLAETDRLLAGGRACLAVVVQDPPGAAGAGLNTDADRIIAQALRSSVPIAVIRPGMLALESGVGAVSSDRIDPTHVVAWLER